MSHEPWAMAFTAATEAEAAVVAGFLESQGIPAKIELRSFRQEPVNFGALMQIRLFVAAEQLEEARRLLADRERRFVLMESAGDEGADSAGEAAPIDAERSDGELED